MELSAFLLTLGTFGDYVNIEEMIALFYEIILN